MKRILYYLLLALLIVAPASAYIVKPGDTLTKLALRYNTTVNQIVKDNNIQNPNLIYVGQDLRIGEAMLGAGYTPVTGYQSRTTGYIDSDDTTIPVASTLDKSGQQISLSNISPSGTVKVYLNLAPGTSKEEPVVCTGVTSASWTNCTRGLAFQGSSETSSSTLAKTHNAGTTIIITNIGQFYNQYVSIDGTQTINNLKTFTTLPYVPTSSPSDPREVVSLYQFQQATSTGGVNGTTTVKGVYEAATDAQLQAGTVFDTTGAPLAAMGQSHRQTSTANKVPVANGSGKLESGWGGSASSLATLDANTLVVQNPANATSSPTANKILLSTASSTIDGEWVEGKTVQTLTLGETIGYGNAVYLHPTSSLIMKTVGTAQTSTYNFIGIALGGGTAGQQIKIQTGGIFTGYTGLTTSSLYYVSNTAGTLTTATGTYAYVVGKALSNSKFLIQPGKKVASGNVTFSASGSSVITTGFKPSVIKIFATSAAVGTGRVLYSYGDWNTTGQNSCTFMRDNGAYEAGQDTTIAWNIFTDNGASDHTHTGTVSSISYNSFTLTNSKAFSPNDVVLHWIAEE